jgi:hypothetical protein
LTYVNPRGIPFGLLRFPLTPRPWAIEPNYSFLFIPAILQWMLFVPALIAGILLWVKKPLTRLPLIYLIVVILLFAAVPDVQGPRHRVQVLPIIVWLQFHFMWMCVRLAQTAQKPVPRLTFRQA